MISNNYCFHGNFIYNVYILTFLIWCCCQNILIQLKSWKADTIPGIYVCIQSHTAANFGKLPVYSLSGKLFFRNIEDQCCNRTVATFDHLHQTTPQEDLSHITSSKHLSICTPGVCVYVKGKTDMVNLDRDMIGLNLLFARSDQSITKIDTIELYNEAPAICIL